MSIAVASWALPALAIDDSSRAAARELVNSGAELFKQAHYEEALRSFMAAYEVAKVPTVAVWAAQANEKLGRLVAASELYESALLMQPNELWVGNTQREAQNKADAALKALKPRIPTLKIELLGAPPSETDVTVDGLRVPSALLALARAVDPGKHVVAAQRGGKSASQELTLREGQNTVVTLTVPPPDTALVAVPPPVPSVSETPAAVPSTTVTPAPAVAPAPATAPPAAPAMLPPVMPPPATPPPPMATQAPNASSDTGNRDLHTRRQLGWIGVGIGAGVLTVGAASAAYVVWKRSQLQNDGCAGDQCPNSTFKSGVAQYNAARTVSTIGLIAGGTLAVAGVTLLLTSPTPEAKSSVGLMIGPGTLALAGEL